MPGGVELPMDDDCPGDSGTVGILRKLVSSAVRMLPELELSSAALATAPGLVAPALTGVTAFVSSKNVIFRFMSSYESPVFSGEGAPGACAGILDASFCATAGESS